MEQTLKIGDRIVVNQLDDTVNRGDIIVFGHGDTLNLEAPGQQPGQAIGAHLQGTSRDGAEQHQLHGPSGSSASRGQGVLLLTRRQVLVNGLPRTNFLCLRDLPFVAGSCEDTANPSPRCFGTSPSRPTVISSWVTIAPQSADSVIACRSSTSASGVREVRRRGPNGGAGGLPTVATGSFGTID